MDPDVKVISRFPVSGVTVWSDADMRKKPDHQKSVELVLMEDRSVEIVTTVMNVTSSLFGRHSGSTSITYQKIGLEPESETLNEQIKLAFAGDDAEKARLIVDIFNEIGPVAKTKNEEVAARREDFIKWAFKNGSVKPDIPDHDETEWIETHSFAFNN